MEEESISDANNITVDTFSHAYNTLRDNANTIFTSEKLDKLYKLADELKGLTINNAKYYESDTVTASDAQSDPKLNLKTLTHTSNGNAKFMHTNNRNYEPKLLSNWTTHVVVLTMNPRIYQRIALIVVEP